MKYNFYDPVFTDENHKTNVKNEFAARKSFDYQWKH